MSYFTWFNLSDIFKTYGLVILFVFESFLLQEKNVAFALSIVKIDR